jgi:hypothetical protein
MLAFCLVVGYVFYYFTSNYLAYNDLPFRGKLVSSSMGVRIYDMPGDEQDIGMLTGGISVALAGEYEDFYYIRTKNGKEGWVQKSMVKNIVDQREIERARHNMLKAIEDSKSKWAGQQSKGESK